MTLTANARVATEKSSRYLQALCGHFSHKTTATWDKENGTVNFPFGVCELKAQPQELIIKIEANDEEGLERGKDVLARHLEKFAAKDGLKVHWQEPQAAAAN